MPRKKLVRTDEYPYHVTARVNNRERFALELYKCWMIFEAHLTKLVSEYECEIHLFVLMPNHFHLMISTPNENLDQAMHYLMRETSKKIGYRARRINHIYGGPYKWSLITDEQYYSLAYKYVCRNPVAANLCKKVQDYPYSSFARIRTHQKMRFPLIDPEKFSSYLPSSEDELLFWVNTPSSKEFDEAMTKALRRSQCKFSGKELTQKALNEEITKMLEKNSDALNGKKVRHTF